MPLWERMCHNNQWLHILQVSIHKILYSVSVSRGRRSKSFSVNFSKLAICYNRSIPCVMFFKKMYTFIALSLVLLWGMIKKIISKLLPWESQMEYTQRANFDVEIFLRFTTVFRGPSKFPRRFNVESTSKMSAG